MKAPVKLANTWLSWMALAAAAALLTSCTTDERAETSPTFAIEKQYSADNTELTLHVSANEVTASDRVVVELEVISPEDEEIDFPKFEEKLGDFQIIDSRRSAPRLVDQERILVTQSYELEPFLPGDYVIPPLKIEHGSRNGDEREALETKEITIKVVSVLTESETDPDIKEIAPPVELPGIQPWVYVAVTLAVLAFTAGVWYLWKRLRRSKEEASPPVPPHDRAYEALEQLLREDLLAKGKVKLFYLRLSNILRHYIEDRFGLQAPERTTEEFLIDLRAGNDFSPEQKSLLRLFLEHCDLVKFAKHAPTQTDSDQAVETCRSFIDDTKQQPEPAASEPAPTTPQDV